jgi:hypothetical protein
MPTRILTAVVLTIVSLFILFSGHIAFATEPGPGPGVEPDRSPAAATWNFTSSTEGWTGRNANARHSPDGNGRLYLDTYGNDPGVVSPSLSLSASTNDKVRMYIWSYCSDRDCNIYFKRSGSSTVYFGGYVYLSGGSSGGTYEVDMSGNANWTGTITQIRIDPSDYCGSVSTPGFVAFDWIQTVDVAPQPITVTDPNGGETWEVGDTERIQWTNPGGYTSFTTYISRNGGSSWSTLESGLPGNYTYRDWTVTGPASTNCRIRVRGYYSGGNNYDDSNSSFTICDPDLDVVYPNGGQTLYMGHDYTVTWTSDCVDENVKIELYKGGTMVRQLNAGTTNDGAQLVNIPVDGTIVAGSDYRIAIATTPSGDPYDFSNSYFTILKPTITVTSPTNGSTYGPGDVVPIRWTTNQVTTNIHVEVYQDASPYLLLDSSTPNDGVYNWTVPADAPSYACFKIGVSCMWGHVYDYSDCFEIVGCSPNLDVTFPDGGETLYMGYDYTVTWSTTTCTDATVKIELYKDATMVLQHEAGTPNDGSQLINLPVDGTIAEGSDYQIAISAVDGDPWDFSGANFTILKPTITITSPTSSSAYQPNDVVPIAWSTNMVTGNMHIEIYNYNAPYMMVDGNSPNDNNEPWTIPSDAPHSARYQVGMSAMSGHVYKFSEYFTIGNPPPVDYPEAVFYSQLAEPWEDDQMGGCPDDMAQSGCAVTCVSMLLNWEDGSATDPDPGVLNAWLGASGGYTPGGCYILWEVAEDYDGEGVGLEYVGSADFGSDDWAALDAEIDAADRMPIVKVDYTTGSATFASHFVVVYDRVGPSGTPSSYLILDPMQTAFSSAHTLALYTNQVNGRNIYGLRKFTGSFPVYAPFITVTSPTAVDAWEAGQTYEITWVSDGIVGDIQIQPYLNDVAQTNIDPSAPNTGSYSWTIPAETEPSTQWQICMSGNSMTVSNCSPYFTIDPIIGVDELQTPTVVTLYPCVPNPFNPATSVRFGLPAATDVKLVVYDVQGRRIATLVNETRASGVYTERWEGRADDGSQVAAGVYFVRLEAGGKTETQKIVMVK